jgi:hypothetical protein
MINDYPSAQVAVRGYNDALNTELANVQAAMGRIAALRQQFTASWPGLLAPQTPGEEHVAQVTASQIASGVPLTPQQVAAAKAQQSADAARIGGEVTRPVVLAPVPTPLSSQQAALDQQRKTGIL